MSCPACSRNLHRVYGNDHTSCLQGRSFTVDSARSAYRGESGVFLRHTDVYVHLTMGDGSVRKFAFTSVSLEHTSQEQAAENTRRAQEQAAATARRAQEQQARREALEAERVRGPARTLLTQLVHSNNYLISMSRPDLSSQGDITQPHTICLRNYTFASLQAGLGGLPVSQHSWDLFRFRKEVELNQQFSQEQLVADYEKYCEHMTEREEEREVCAVCVCSLAFPPSLINPVALLPLAQRQREAGESSSLLDECCVCTDAIPEECAVALPCAHLFHKACREQLCTYSYDTDRTTPNKNKCPICRIDFKEPLPDSVVDSVLQGISNISVQPEAEAEADSEEEEEEEKEEQG